MNLTSGIVKAEWRGHGNPEADSGSKSEQRISKLQYRKRFLSLLPSIIVGVLEKMSAAASVPFGCEVSRFS